MMTSTTIPLFTEYTVFARSLNSAILSATQLHKYVADNPDKTIHVGLSGDENHKRKFKVKIFRNGSVIAKDITYAD